MSRRISKGIMFDTGRITMPVTITREYEWTCQQPGCGKSGTISTPNRKWCDDHLLLSQRQTPGVIMDGEYEWSCKHPECIESGKSSVPTKEFCDKHHRENRSEIEARSQARASSAVNKARFERFMDRAAGVVNQESSPAPAKEKVPVTALTKLPPGPMISNGRLFDYSKWEEGARFAELDRYIRFEDKYSKSATMNAPEDSNEDRSNVAALRSGGSRSRVQTPNPNP